MSLRPEELRGLAEEALMEARRADDLDLRRQWLNVAGALIALARESLIVSQINGSQLETPMRPTRVPLNHTPAASSSVIYSRVTTISRSPGEQNSTVHGVSED